MNMKRFYSFPTKLRIFCHGLSVTLSVSILFITGLLDREMLGVFIQTGGGVALIFIFIDILILAIVKRVKTIGTEMEVSETGLSIDNKKFFIHYSEVISIDLKTLKQGSLYILLTITLKDGRVFRFEQNHLEENITLLKNIQAFAYPITDPEKFGKILEKLTLKYAFNKIPLPSVKFIIITIVVSILVVSATIGAGVYTARKFCAQSTDC